MSNFQILLQSAHRVSTLEHYGYTLGYVNAEYAHDFITKDEYDQICNILKQKRRELI